MGGGGLSRQKQNILYERTMPFIRIVSEWRVLFCFVLFCFYDKSTRPF